MTRIGTGLVQLALHKGYVPAADVGAMLCGRDSQDSGNVREYVKHSVVDDANPRYGSVLPLFAHCAAHQYRGADMVQRFLCPRLPLAFLSLVRDRADDACRCSSILSDASVVSYARAGAVAGHRLAGGRPSGVFLACKSPISSTMATGSTGGIPLLSVRLPVHRSSPLAVVCTVCGQNNIPISSPKCGPTVILCPYC